jgi:hypothetical protein
MGSAPRLFGEWSRRKQGSVTFQLSHRMTSVGPVPVSVIRQAVSWSRFSSYWDTFLCKQPSDTSVANSASTTRPVIGSGSSQTGRDLRRFHLTDRLSQE